MNEKMEQVWGERCNEHKDGCPVCEAYRIADKEVEVTEDAVYMACFKAGLNDA